MSNSLWNKKRQEKHAQVNFLKLNLKLRNIRSKKRLTCLVYITYCKATLYEIAKDGLPPSAAEQKTGWEGAIRERSEQCCLNELTKNCTNPWGRLPWALMKDLSDYPPLLFLWAFIFHILPHKFSYILQNLLPVVFGHQVQSASWFYWVPFALLISEARPKHSEESASGWGGPMLSRFLATTLLLLYDSLHLVSPFFPSTDLQSQSDGEFN